MQALPHSLKARSCLFLRSELPHDKDAEQELLILLMLGAPHVRVPGPGHGLRPLTLSQVPDTRPKSF